MVLLNYKFPQGGIVEFRPAFMEFQMASAIDTRGPFVSSHSSAGHTALS